MSSSDPQLVEIGERRLIAEVLVPRYGKEGYRFGDDCAVLSVSGSPGDHTVATTDPCPEPMAVVLGSQDLYHWGWLLATINLSDLAAAGARPTGLLTSIVLPNETPLSDFERLLDGIDDCARQSSTRVVGGNLKEGPRIDLVGTAIGITAGPPLSRIGTRPGDRVAVVGSFGRYWAGVLSLMRKLTLDDETSALLAEAVRRPRAELESGQVLQGLGVVSACLDNSDGLYAALRALSTSNSLGFRLAIEESSLSPVVREIAHQAGVDPVRLTFGFGDWNLICTFPEEAEAGIRAAMAAIQTDLLVLGEAVVGDGLSMEYKGVRGTLCSPDSERFRSGSMFTAGIESYVDALLEAPFLETVETSL